MGRLGLKSSQNGFYLFFMKFSLSLSPPSPLLYFLFVVFLPAFVGASAAKNLMLDYFAVIFCGAESSINAIDVA